MHEINLLKGALMHEICPHCGKESNEEEPRFCSGCGARMDGMAPPLYAGSPSPLRPLKNQMTAGLCSTFLPGLGQVYDDEPVGKGFLVFLLTLLGLIILVIPGLVVWIYGMFDAYNVAGKMNTGELAFRDTRMLHMALFMVFRRDRGYYCAHNNNGNSDGDPDAPDRPDWNVPAWFAGHRKSQPNIRYRRPQPDLRHWKSQPVIRYWRLQPDLGHWKSQPVIGTGDLNQLLNASGLF